MSTHDGKAPLRVCLIRHASTRWNEAGRIQGGTDLPLSERGRAQLAAWRLPPGFARADCVTSPLRRARETACRLGWERPASDPRLAEMSWGDFEGRTLAGLRQEHGPEMAALEALGLDFRPPGGESPREVVARLAAFLAERAATGADLVLVTHKGVLRAALVLALGWTMQGRPPVRFDPERALILELDPAGRPTAAAAVSLRGSEN